MAIRERFSNLPEYAFPRLRTLLAGIQPGLHEGEAPAVLTIGEPRHAFHAARRTLVVSGFATGHRFGVRTAGCVAALGALGLRQQIFDAVG